MPTQQAHAFKCFRGDHIVPNFEEIWPSNKDKSAKYKRRLIGMEYYLDAMEHHGLKGHLPQPDNFTTCGKLGIEINQYNCPIEVGAAFSTGKCLQMSCFSVMTRL